MNWQTFILDSLKVPKLIRFTSGTHVISSKFMASLHENKRLKWGFQDVPWLNHSFDKDAPEKKGSFRPTHPGVFIHSKNRGFETTTQHIYKYHDKWLHSFLERNVNPTQFFLPPPRGGAGATPDTSVTWETLKLASQSWATKKKLRPYEIAKK